MEKILLGNEAVARGAYEYGVTVATAYPGTPSTEITESITKYKEIDVEWSPNEKVALEVGIGASIAGARTLVSMKHVGRKCHHPRPVWWKDIFTDSVPYPEQLKEKLMKLPISFYSIDALAYAQKAGSIKTVNVVFIGALAAIIDIEKETWYEAIKENVPTHLIDINLKAFELGFRHV